MFDFYWIWMLEIMLQQIIVVVVKEYFLCFIECWLMVMDFVNVCDEDVMGEWVGFGYYVCVRNLLKCVCVVV